MRTQPSESGFQALAVSERIKPVREAQIHVDDFRVPSPVHLLARRAVQKRSAAFWTVAQHEADLVGKKIHACGGRQDTAAIPDCLLGKARRGFLCEP